MTDFIGDDLSGARFERVNLTAGGANLALDGSLGETAALDFKLEASDLSIVAPDSRGRLTAKGSIHGTFAAPIVQRVLPYRLLQSVR